MLIFLIISDFICYLITVATETDLPEDADEAHQRDAS